MRRARESFQHSAVVRPVTSFYNAPLAHEFPLVDRVFVSDGIAFRGRWNAIPWGPGRVAIPTLSPGARASLRVP